MTIARDPERYDALMSGGERVIMTVWDVYYNGEFNGMWRGTVKANTRREAVVEARSKYVLDDPFVFPRNQKDRMS